MRISGWGHYPIIESEVIGPLTPSSVKALLAGGFRGVARGLGRSYGDSALAQQLISTHHLSHILAFDETDGRIRCAAGATLADLLEVFVPRGWFPPVTPGTRFVTVGGAIASDIHGKNHHGAGSFTDHVDSLTLLLGDGSVVACSRNQHPELFRATCGGMGLTGIILEACFALKPIRSAYVRETILKAANLAEALVFFEQHAEVTYSVAWVDCLSRGAKLGRSLLMLGEHAEDGDLELSKKSPVAMPFDLPHWLLNRYTVSAFNTLYYHHVRSRRTERVVHYEPFFYPLDGILHWNRLYGKRGFTQYQLVLPKAAGIEGLRTILDRIAQSRRGSFLAVLKAFGKGNDNYLSFPMEGYTLALDFKLEPGLLEFLNELDRLVLDYGGRLYLTKDVHMSQETFRGGYPWWEKFVEVRRQYHAEPVFRSLQSERLGI